MRHLPGGSGRDCCEEIGQNLQQILHAVAPAVNQDDRDREIRKMLLEGEVLVHRDKDLELSLREGKQLSIRDARPAFAENGVSVEPDDVRCKTSVHALVEQYPQAAAVTARSAAFSKNSTT